MPFDTSDYKIKVEFNAQMGKHILPVSHTCFKSIEIPHYTSYDLMKKKLDTAFSIGAEGFGFGWIIYFKFQVIGSFQYI